MSQAVILTPDELRDFKNEVIRAISEKFGEMKGTVIESPMTMVEAAKFCKCHRTTFWKYVKEGVVKPHKLGKTPLFYATELNEAIKRRK